MITRRFTLIRSIERWTDRFDWFDRFDIRKNPKINENLIYDYRGVKTKAPYNTSGWNSVYVAGKIIKKIGPILAINNEEFTGLYVAEKFN